MGTPGQAPLDTAGHGSPVPGTEPAPVTVVVGVDAGRFVLETQRPQTQNGHGLLRSVAERASTR